MVIYLEYLFLENFLTGGLLLFLTAKLSGDSPGKLRILLGSTAAGAGGFTIFIPVSGVWGAVIRIGLTFLICTITFGLKPVRLLKRAAVFLALTFLSGGAAMAFSLWQQIPAVSGNGALYMQPLTYGRLICLSIPAFALTCAFVRLMRERRMDTITKGKVCLTIKEKVYSFEALVDSGNSLREPFTGRPVALVDRKGAERLPFNLEKAEDDESISDRYVTIPFKAVGTDSGLLHGIRTDSLSFRGKEHRGAVIAFYDGDFGDFEVLLNREVLDEGIT